MHAVSISLCSVIAYIIYVIFIIFDINCELSLSISQCLGFFHFEKHKVWSIYWIPWNKCNVFLAVTKSSILLHIGRHLKMLNPEFDGDPVLCKGAVRLGMSHASSLVQFFVRCCRSLQTSPPFPPIAWCIRASGAVGASHTQCSSLNCFYPPPVLMYTERFRLDLCSVCQNRRSRHK